MAGNHNGDHSALRDEGFVPSASGRNWYRGGNLLALAGDADKVDYVLRHRVFPRAEVRRERVAPGLERFSWDGDDDPGDVVDTVREVTREIWGERYVAKVSPNHLFGSSLDQVTGQPFDAGGPAGFPRLPTDDEPVELMPRTTDDRSGEGVVVGIVDTGIARGASMGAAADWLQGAFLATPDDIDELQYKRALGNQAGHGTFIAGVVLQHAPYATVRAARALAPNGIGDGSDVAAAIDRLARAGIHILNLSLGCFSRQDRSSQAIEDALARLDSDIVVVAAAGNLARGRPGEGAGHDDHHHEPVTTARPFWPAALPKVISVGALKSDGRSPALADFSNHGEWVSAYAKGLDVFSTFLDVDDTRDPKGTKRFNGYCYWSGTSFAAPAVAGTIAARMHRDRISAQHAAERVLEEADRHSLIEREDGEPFRGPVLDLEPAVQPLAGRAGRDVGVGTRN